MGREMKRIYRSAGEARIAGVCAGFGEYLAVDPVLVRLGWLAATFLTGIVPGTLAYLAAWIVVPPAPEAGRVARPAPPAGASEAHGGPA